MRTLVISIKPRWVGDILSGAKTVELRRRPPGLSGPTPALVYATAPLSRIRARCDMGPVISSAPADLWREVGRRSCVTQAEFFSYFDGVALAHAIEVSGAEELRDGPTLDVMRREIGVVPPQAWAWASERLVRAAGAGSGAGEVRAGVRDVLAQER